MLQVNFFSTIYNKIILAVTELNHFIYLFKFHLAFPHFYVKFEKMEYGFCENDYIKTIFDPRKITLCLRGTKVEARWSCLGRLPNSRLGQIRFARSLNEIKELCDGFDSEKNEIYFNKAFAAFDSIIDFYNNDQVHLRKEECVNLLYVDMCYWGIHEVDIQLCCYLKYDKMKRECIEQMAEIDKIANVKKVAKTYSVCCLDSRKTLWLLMEHPESSALARVWIAFFA